MTRGDYGVWELTLPAKDGQPAIPHNSKIKVTVPEVYCKDHLVTGV